jgi:hypothetical protein
MIKPRIYGGSVKKVGAMLSNARGELVFFAEDDTLRESGCCRESDIAAA